MLDTEPRVVARNRSQKCEAGRFRYPVHAEARRTAIDDAQQPRAIEPVDDHRHAGLASLQPRKFDLPDETQRTAVELGSPLVTRRRISSRRAKPLERGSR